MISDGKYKTVILMIHYQKADFTNCGKKPSNYLQVEFNKITRHNPV